ncbi:DUF961 family protein [Enterococcus faecalis]|uniref:DUF961 family protein n=1 Tax=Enterococcus faecalis TaxID=1351 RepID=UPI00032EB7B0|nr:DUF961 family protein [Enterococcus faecalis]EOK44839.1 hypothetical protein WUG_00010 [Enterococcus faecalis EnGen0332]
MVKEQPITFEENKIPVLFNETVGKTTFVAVRSPKFERDEEGKLTDKVRAVSIEVSSEAQRETFNVDLPADFDVSGFKFGDTIEIEGVDEVEPWAQMPAGARGVNNAYVGFSVIATGIRKVTLSASQNQGQSVNHSTKQKEEEKGKA